MRCVFCKKNSENSKSIEHIIPESLGNKEHILEKGIVCDNCNNYFALKIEKIVLDKPYFKGLRHRNFIESKKGIIPRERALIGGDFDVFIDNNKGERSILINNPNTVNKITNQEVFQMIVPHFTEPTENDKDISRFLGKIAIEVLVHHLYPNQEWVNEIIDKPELNSLRDYVRIGNKPNFWEYHQRRIYNEEDRFLNQNISSEPYEVLHEFTLLHTDNFELYLVIAIMGIEYSINLSDPKIDGYKKWLIENDYQTPLYDSNKRKIINDIKNG